MGTATRAAAVWTHRYLMICAAMRSPVHICPPSQKKLNLSTAVKVMYRNPGHSKQTGGGTTLLVFQPEKQSYIIDHFPFVHTYVFYLCIMAQNKLCKQLLL